jgi:hypothetical protein
LLACVPAFHLSSFHPFIISSFHPFILSSFHPFILSCLLGPSSLAKRVISWCAGAVATCVVCVSRNTCSSSSFTKNE